MKESITKFKENKINLELKGIANEMEDARLNNGYLLRDLVFAASTKAKQRVQWRY